MIKTPLSILLMMTPALVFAENQNDKLLEELKALTDKSREERAADRWLQNDLEALIARHSAPEMEILLFENFEDRRFRPNPDWKVTGGHFEFDRGYALVSEVDSSKVTGDATPSAEEKELSREEAVAGLLVGLIMKEKGKAKSQPESMPSEVKASKAQPANIILPTVIKNAFLLETELTLNELNEEARIEIAVYQTAKERYGYRLRMKTGKRGYLEIERVRNNGTSIVESISLPEGLSDGNSHQLSWLHDSSGRIVIKLDDNLLLQGEDKVFKDDYGRFSVTNRSGSLAIHSLKISG